MDPVLNFLTIIIDVMTMLTTIMTPPIVGVPVFFICDFGPSSLMLCPNFKRLKKGINMGDNRTVNIKEIAMFIIKSYIFTALYPPRTTTVHANVMADYFFLTLRVNYGSYITLQLFEQILQVIRTACRVTL